MYYPRCNLGFHPPWHVHLMYADYVATMLQYSLQKCNSKVDARGYKGLGEYGGKHPYTHHTEVYIADTYDNTNSNNNSTKISLCNVDEEWLIDTTREIHPTEVSSTSTSITTLPDLSFQLRDEGKDRVGWVSIFPYQILSSINDSSSKEGGDSAHRRSLTPHILRVTSPPLLRSLPPPSFRPLSPLRSPI